MPCVHITLCFALLYGIVITYFHLRLPPLNPLCTRDFLQPAAYGSCLCGENSYCLCTPSLAVDAIVELRDESGRVDRIALVQRGDGRGLAIIGGFLKVGESAEAGVRREVLEETGLVLGSVRQWCVFSSPERDRRRHTASMVFIAQGRSGHRLKAGDDAKSIRTFAVHELQEVLPKFAFDHGMIVAAYLSHFHPAAPTDSPHPPRARTRLQLGQHEEGSMMAQSILYAQSCPEMQSLSL